MMRLASSGLAILVVTGCVPPLQPCLPECGPRDAAPDPRDAGVDADIDAGSDGGTDAGPTPIEPELDGTTLPDRVCTLGHWCWVSPAVPEAEWDDTVAVGTGAWVVTETAIGSTPGGARVYYDGTSWRGLVGVGARIVGASSASDVWFVAGDHDVSHWDGSAFEAVELDEAVVVNDIASVSADAAWIVGDAGVLRKWDGMRWSSVDVGLDVGTDLRAIDVVAADDIWIGGTGGAIRHWDGTAWLPVDAPADFVVDAIWALPGSTTVWIGGPSGARYWNATAMEWRTPTGSVAANIVAIAGRAADSVYLLSSGEPDFRAFHTALSAVSDSGTECDFRSVTPFGDASYLRVGRRTAEGTLACPIDVRPLTPSDAAGTSPVARPLGEARSVEILGADQLLVYSDAHAYLGNPMTGAFTVTDTLVPEGIAPGTIAIEASHGAADLFVDTHDGSVRHWNGTAWASIEVRAGATDVIFAASGAATWAAAGDTVYEWNGTAFVPVGTLADEVTQLAVAGTAIFATHGGGTTLSLFAEGAWTAVTTAWPSECRPLVARDSTTVECIGTEGRMQLVVDDTPAAELVGTTGSVPAFDAENLYSLAGDHGWIFALDATGGSDEQILWPDAAGDAWQSRSSGLARSSSDVVRMRADGSTWRTTDGALIELLPR